jgi:hypothetical protein
MKNSVQLQSMSGWRTFIATCVTAVLVTIPPKPVLAIEIPLSLDTSFGVGPIAVQLNTTNPVVQSGVFRSTLHIHVRDDTQTPAFNGDLVAIGSAADANTLLGGLLPAAIILKQDLLASMTFEQAVADAETKTGVRVTFFNDASMVEYALGLLTVLIVVVGTLPTVSPLLHDHACTIKTNLQAGLLALGYQNPPDPCVVTP